MRAAGLSNALAGITLARIQKMALTGLRCCLAGVPGLEPRLSEPESLVLPITPYPKGSSTSSPANTPERTIPDQRHDPHQRRSRPPAGAGGLLTTYPRPDSNRRYCRERAA